MALQVRPGRTALLALQVCLPTFGAFPLQPPMGLHPLVGSFGRAGNIYSLRCEGWAAATFRRPILKAGDDFGGWVRSA